MVTNTSGVDNQKSWWKKSKKIFTCLLLGMRKEKSSSVTMGQGRLALRQKSCVQLLCAKCVKMFVPSIRRRSPFCRGPWDQAATKPKSNRLWYKRIIGNKHRKSKKDHVFLKKKQHGMWGNYIDKTLSKRSLRSEIGIGLTFWPCRKHVRPEVKIWRCMSMPSLTPPSPHLPPTATVGAGSPWICALWWFWSYFILRVVYLPRRNSGSPMAH